MSYTYEKLKTTILFDRLRDIANETNFLENNSYNDFVKDSLINIINSCKINGSSYEIVDKYYNYLRNAQLAEIKYLVFFLKKYHLISFLPLGYPDNIKFNYKSDLTQSDILEAYEKELALVNCEKKDNKIINPSIFERLDKYTTIEERQAHIRELENIYEDSLRSTEQENNYNNFIIDRENGLYRVLENALYKYDSKKFILSYNPLNINFEYIKEFCDKYGIDIKMIERGESISKDYLLNIKTLEDIRNLFNCFFVELQQIEYFSKTKEELWEEHKKFVSNNEEWLKSKNHSR